MQLVAHIFTRLIQSILNVPGRVSIPEHPIDVSLFLPDFYLAKSLTHTRTYLSVSTRTLCQCLLSTFCDCDRSSATITKPKVMFQGKIRADGVCTPGLPSVLYGTVLVSEVSRKW